MGAILGLGTTHSPPLAMPPERSIGWFKQALSAPHVDPAWNDRSRWPAGLRAEWADDEGRSASERHRARLIENFRAQRRMLDDFAPDFIVIFGDDQYENFREDIVPPFCIYGLEDSFECRPWSRKAYAAGNAWGVPSDWPLRLRGHRDGAKWLASALIERDVIMPYAYQLLHQDVPATAFTNTIAYLDYDLAGFQHPVVPFHVNCYGSDLLQAKGQHRARLFEEGRKGEVPDPPSPSARLCMSLGAHLAEILLASPYRVALVASSSWSHAALSTNTGRVIPDHARDRALLEAFRSGDFNYWRALSRATLEAAGQHEILNWMLLVGAMEVLGRTPVIDDYLETWMFQANKVFASYQA
jgi:hypothetical protein